MPVARNTAFCCAKLKERFVSSQPGPAAWEFFGDLLNHLETRFIGGIGKADLPAREAQEHLLLAESPITVEIDFACCQVCERLDQTFLPAHIVEARSGDRHIRLAVRLLLHANFFANFQKGAVIGGRLAKTRQLLEKRLVVKEADPRKRQAEWS